MVNNVEKEKKVVVGMSGGVDSSAVAAILKQKGYTVYGLTLVTSDAADTADARLVAENLGISYATLDVRKAFQEQIKARFVESYLRAETPNPCLLCNPLIKWRYMLSYADDIGADFVATGHYAEKVLLPSGRVSLRRRGKKDQSYALYALGQEALQRTLFPLAGLEKDAVRRIAAEAGLSVAEKADSQDICFVPDGDYAGFIKRACGSLGKEGHFVSPEGTVYGPHKGIVNYTVGQRKGLGIALGRPVFVTEISPQSGDVVLGTKEQLLTHSVRAKAVNFMAEKEVDKDLRLFGKVRYNHKGGMATVRISRAGIITAVFDEPVSACPGQTLVLYENEAIYGGGTIIRGGETGDH